MTNEIDNFSRDSDFPCVTIVIPVFNEEKYIGQCLSSVSRLDYPAKCIQVLLVDNGSTDRTLEIAREFDVDIHIKKDVKVGAVRNHGVLHSKNDIIVFLDSDCIVEKNWLNKGVTLLQLGPDCVGGLYLLRSKPSWIESGWLLKSGRDFVYQKTLVGGCIFIIREVFRSMGGFDENLSAGEDTDLNRRLVENGYEVVIDPVLSIVHLGYPNTILSFVKRQIWHSEDCYQRLPGALNDKVFMITQLYLLGLGFLCISMVMPTTPYIGFSIVCACPAILTIKRLLRYEIYAPTIRKLVFAYVIDHLYLIGRVLGAARSLKKVLFKLDQRKYERR